MVAVAAWIAFAAPAVFVQAAIPDCSVCGCADCNGNGVDDRCDVSCSNSGIRCVGNPPVALWDFCNSGQFPSCGTSPDCNANDVPDECDITSGASADDNCNGVPDECQQCNNLWTWVTPCVGGLTCDLGPPTQGPSTQGLGSGQLCWCEGDWADATDWVFTDSCSASCTPAPGYPDDPLDHPLINKSNTDLCVGGNRDGQPCNPNAECPLGESCFLGICTGGQSCNPNAECPGTRLDPGECVFETELRINISTDTVGHFTIQTNATGGNASLTVKFQPKQGGAKTLTAKTLTLDATNGQVTIKAADGAVLQTDPTD